MEIQTELPADDPRVLVTYVPAPAEIESERVRRTIASLVHDEVRSNRAPFWVPPRAILAASGAHLDAEERSARRLARAALQETQFSVMVVAGTHTSDFMRELLGLAQQHEVVITSYAESDSELGKMTRWFQR